MQPDLGTVSLDPGGPVVAGQVGQWTLVLTVGALGIDEGGLVCLVQRMACDWEAPQFERPADAGFTTVATSGEARLRARYRSNGYQRPWMKCLEVEVYDGSLAPGEKLTIVLGDQSQGSPGIRAQTFQETGHEFRMLVDPTNARCPRVIPGSPVVPIVAGDTAGMVCGLPSDALVDEPVEVFLRGADAWGNPTPLPDGVILTWEGSCPGKIEGRRLQLSGQGAGRVLASWQGRAFPSNPVVVASERPRHSRYWGDLHAQTEATVGTGSEAEYFAFGRDQARLDFISHQGNDFQVSDQDWERLNRVTGEFHEDGRYVVFPGYEWSGNTPAGGDRNVIYLEEGKPILRSHHWQISEAADKLTPAHPAGVLFQRLREVVGPDKVVLAAHAGGRYADVRGFFDEELGPLIEVASCWGVFEWLLWDALEAGHRVGVIAASDGHKGRPGAEGPGAGLFGIAGGLTCVLAEELTRKSIFRALRARRCYATTGPRMALSFEVDGQPMGSALSAAGPVRARAAVRGCGPLESLTLYEGRKEVRTVRPAAFENVASSRRIRISWSGARTRGRSRRAVWDGQITVSGARILESKTFAFDSPDDGILTAYQQLVRFRSRTTGDVDGIDLLLDQAKSGSLELRTQVGGLEVDLAELGASPQTRGFGGVDLQASIRRYPEVLEELALELEESLQPADRVIPYFVKVTQEDGHMAWSSPVYLQSGA